MNAITRIAGTAGLALAATALVAAPAAANSPAHSAGAIFAQTDNLTGNTLVAYDRGAGGRLHQSGVYRTGGLGGRLTGAVVDFTASQGALTLDRAAGLLYAVNAATPSPSSTCTATGSPAAR